MYFSCLGIMFTGSRQYKSQWHPRDKEIDGTCVLTINRLIIGWSIVTSENCINIRCWSCNNVLHYLYVCLLFLILSLLMSRTVIPALLIGLNNGLYALIKMADVGNIYFLHHTNMMKMSPNLSTKLCIDTVLERRLNCLDCKISVALAAEKDSLFYLSHETCISIIKTTIANKSEMVCVFKRKK